MPIYDWDNGYTDDPAFPDGIPPLPPQGAVIRDAITGEEIKEVFWLNTGTNELCRPEIDANGNWAIDQEKGEVKRITERRQVTVEFPGRPTKGISN